MKKDEPFDFKKFIQESLKHENLTMKEAIELPGAEQLTEFCGECYKIGLNIMQTQYPNGQGAVLAAGTSYITAVNLASGDIESTLLQISAMENDAIREMIWFMFLFALGLSVKEELR